MRNYQAGEKCIHGTYDGCEHGCQWHATAAEAQAADDKLVPLVGTISFTIPDPHIEQILSLMIFSTGPISHKMRRMGYDIQRRAEHEQFAVFMWLLNMYQKHGDKWQDEANALLKTYARKNPTEQAQGLADAGEHKEG